MNHLDHIQPLRTCDLCGHRLSHNCFCLARGEVVVHDFRARVSTVVCRTCKFIFQPEVFSEESLMRLYAQDRGFETAESETTSALVRRYREFRQAFITEALEGMASKAVLRILDVGGGIGDCTEHLATKHDVTVLDANDTPPRNPKVTKLVGPFQTTSFSKPFDVIVMNHILEHVFSPNTLLSRARDLLTPGGRLVVEVPYELYTPLVFRRTGDWRHVAYFSRDTLRKHLTKAGFATHRLGIELGHYGDRRLPVIRAVAMVAERAEEPALSTGYWPLLHDLLDFRAVRLTIQSRMSSRCC